jgi:hypothetical protein
VVRERRERPVMGRMARRGWSVMGRGWSRRGMVGESRRWRWREMSTMRWEWSMRWRGRGRGMARPASRNVLTVATFTGGSGERTNNVPNGLSDPLSRIGLLVGRTVRRSVEIGVDVRSRTTNFLRSTIELITMRSPVGTISDVLHDAPQRSGELRVLYERGAHYAEECGDVAGKRRDGPSGIGIEVCERRIWSIVGRRGARGWNLLNVDSSIRGEGDAMVRDLVDVDRGFLWGVVGENRIGRRGSFVLASFAFISRHRCESPGVCGGSTPSHARADAAVATDLGKLELVPRSRTNLGAIEGIESRDPLPIIFNGLLVERDGPKRIVGRNVAEPVRDRRSVRERLLLGAADNAEIYDR